MLALAPLCLALAPQVHELPSDSPFEVEGVVASSIQFRVVDEGGAPVSGASATFFSQAPGWGGAVELVGSATSDGSGAVLLPDLVTDHPVHLVLERAPEFRRRILPVPSQCGGELRLGDLLLERNLRVTGRVELGDTGSGVPFGRVRLLTRDADEDVVAYGSIRGGTFFLEEFPRVPLWIEVRPSLEHSAPSLRLAWDPSREVPEWVLLLRVRSDALELAGEGRPTEARPPEPGYRFAGRVVLPDGRPAAGLPVRLEGSTIYDRATEAEAVGATDAEGRFDLWTRSELVTQVSVLFPDGGLEHVPAKGPERAPRPTGEAPGSSERVQSAARAAPDDGPIVLPVQGALELEVRGAESADVEWAFLADGAWHPTTRELAGIVTTAEPRGRVLRASLPGHLPRMVPIADDAPGALVDFTRDVPFALTVEGSGAKALVVERWEAAGAKPREQRLARLDVHTAEDSTGELGFRADPNRTYFARVTAPGCDPVLQHLRPGTTSVTLRPRRGSARLDGALDGDLDGSVLRVKPRGRDALVAYVRTRATETASVALAAGEYEASLTTPAGALVWGSTFAVAEGESVALDLAEDARPRVRLELPELPRLPTSSEEERAATPGAPALGTPDRWWIWATRTVRPGWGIGAMASSTVGVRVEEEPPAVASRLDDGRFELALSGSGPWTILAGPARGSVDAHFACEVDVAPGAVLDLVLPPLDGQLVGSMSGFHSDRDYAHHGVAAPRLELLPVPDADSPSRPGWRAVVGFPTREGDGDAFRVRGLPSGAYRLRHHLATGGAAPLGALPVEVRAEPVDEGETADGAEASRAEPVPDFQAWPAGAFTVRVVDSQGELVRDARLTVRDRLFEAWHTYAQLPTTGSLALRPLPPPPAFRLAGEPVEFPAVQTGWLEFLVQTDSGERWSFACDVAPKDVVELVVPR